MIVAGFGFRAGAGVDSLKAALAATGARPDALATAADKAEAAAMRALAADLGLPLHAVALDRLDGRAALSPRVPSRYGAKSVAEASALAIAGPNGRLITGRTPSPDGMAVAAIAEGDGQ